MDTIELTQEQHDIYVFAMEQSPLSANASLKNFQFDEAVTDNHVVAYARMGVEEQNAWGIVALPEISTKVFIGITDSEPETFSELIASFEAESEVNDALGFGHIAPVDKEIFSQVGWSGVLIVKVSELVDGFPDNEVLNGEVYDFHLVVPITQEEMVYGRRHGGEALIEKMHLNNRDFFTFIQSPILDKNVSHQSSTAETAPNLQTAQHLPINLIASIDTTDNNLIPAPPSSLADDELPKFEDIIEPTREELATKSMHNSEKTAFSEDQLIKSDLQKSALKTEGKSKQNKLTSLKYWHISKKNQVIGETVIGTLLLFGGAFFSGQLYRGNYGMLAIFTAVFSIAGLIILISAAKDSQSLSE